VRSFWESNNRIRAGTVRRGAFASFSPLVAAAANHRAASDSAAIVWDLRIDPLVAISRGRRDLEHGADEPAQRIHLSFRTSRDGEFDAELERVSLFAPDALQCLHIGFG